MKHKKGANTSQKILLGIFIILAIAALAMVFMQVSATGFAIFGTNNAAFVYQNVPTEIAFGAPPLTIITGWNSTVTVIMNNTGTNSWTTVGKYRLGSKSPQSNTIWGINRVELPASPINKGKAASFTFPIKAPTTPGNYSFQWGMLQEGKTWFGTPTPTLTIQVKNAVCTDLDGGIDIYNQSSAKLINGFNVSEIDSCATCTQNGGGTTCTPTTQCSGTNCVLLEAICKPGNLPANSYPRTTTITCDYGCANGACKPNTPPAVVCGDGLCGTGEQCEWNGTSQSQFKCPDSPIPTGQYCSGCMLYNSTSTKTTLDLEISDDSGVDLSDADPALTSVEAIHFTADSSKLEVITNHPTSTQYIYTDEFWIYHPNNSSSIIQIYYRDPSTNSVKSGGALSMTQRKDRIAMFYRNNNQSLYRISYSPTTSYSTPSVLANISIEYYGGITSVFSMSKTNSTVTLGNTYSLDEPTELILVQPSQNGTFAYSLIGSNRTDIVTHDGITIHQPSLNGGLDKVMITIPLNNTN